MNGQSAENQPVKQLRCNSCSHTQTAQGILVNGNLYFGSKRHFCDECEGPMSELTEDQSISN